MTSPDIIWSAKDAAAATGGRAIGAWSATGISIDTRTLKKGDLFIAIRGGTLDGHDYVKKALELGAAAAVVSRVPEGVAQDAPLLLVDDAFVAMQELGLAARKRAGAKIVAVTGSVGKTGTKEMLAAAFGALGVTHASRASHNNHWGVPLSLAGLAAGADTGIFEIGMNHAGEITPLSQMVKPHIAIITTIAPVHMEHFDYVGDIADAKAEIFDGMDHDGVAVLNRDNEWYSHLAGKAKARGVQTVSFGEGEDADARLMDCIEAANGSRIKASIAGEEVSFMIMIPGRHIAMNAIAVLLAVKVAGGNVQKAARSLEFIQPVPGRGLREYLDVGDPKNPVTLIDESYNASPVAMRAAFKVLAMVDPGRGGRRIAFLGDMLELGKDGPRQHAELALPLEAADVQLVYTSGVLMKNLHDALPANRRGAHKDSSKELAQIVTEVLTPGDVVMVKGSSGSKMNVVVEAMRGLPEKLKKKKGGETNHAL